MKDVITTIGYIATAWIGCSLFTFLTAFGWLRYRKGSYSPQCSSCNGTGRISSEDDSQSFPCSRCGKYRLTAAEWAFLIGLTLLGPVGVIVFILFLSIMD